MTGEVIEPGSVYIRAKCQPTMHKDHPFYTLLRIELLLLATANAQLDRPVSIWQHC